VHAECPNPLAVSVNANRKAKKTFDSSRVVTISPAPRARPTASSHGICNNIMISAMKRPLWDRCVSLGDVQGLVGHQLKSRAADACAGVCFHWSEQMHNSELAHEAKAAHEPDTAGAESRVTPPLRPSASHDHVVALQDGGEVLGRTLCEATRSPDRSCQDQSRDSHLIACLSFTYSHSTTNLSAFSTNLHIQSNYCCHVSAHQCRHCCHGHVFSLHIREAVRSGSVRWRFIRQIHRWLRPDLNGFL
jgi:hypothetical protein